MRSYAAAVSQIADEAAATRRRMSSAQNEQQSTLAAQAAWAAPLNPATGHPETTATNPHDEAVASATASLNQARAALNDLSDQRTVADHRVIAALRQAHHAGMKNKPWWRSALAAASAALADITVVLILVAVVAIVVLAIVQPELIPGLLLLSGQVLSGLSAGQLAVDGTRKAVGDDVSWGSLAMDALGALPGLGELTDLTKLADLTRGAALGEKATAVAGRLADAVTTAATTLRDTATAFRAAAQSVVTDIKGVCIIVRVVETTTGVRVPVIESGGKTLGQMLTNARRAVSSATGGAILRHAQRLSDLFGGSASPTASDLARYAEDQGWTLSKTADGPLKYIDDNGIVRMTIKRGSPRSPGSLTPHVELRDPQGRRIDPYGRQVTRKSPDNHTPITWDIS
jgi:hypothetical protein